MGKSGLSAIEQLACDFLKTAREYVSNTVDDSEGLSSLYGNPNIEIRGPILGMDDNVREKQEDLVKKCVTFLGTELGSEEEIEELAWKHVWMSFSKSKPLADVSDNARLFVDQISEYRQRTYAYIAPNHLLKFTGDAKRIVVGPVEAMKTEQLVASQKKVPNAKTIWQQVLDAEPVAMEFHVGSKFDFSISENRMLIELPECCWVIPMGSVKAARRNAEEVAIWLINIAVSLLRFCHPNPKHSSFPKRGDVEEMAIAEPKEFWLGGRREEKGLVLGAVEKSRKRRTLHVGFSVPVSSSVRRVSCTYAVDDAVVQATEEDRFKDRAQQIFHPAKKSLAERLGQGLGWLSRGRQTGDRAERFLFFFTAIEALLCSDDATSPIVQTISRYVAVILRTDPDERAKCAARLRALYRIRSELVHAGKRNVSQAQSIEVQGIAEELYKTVMENYPLERRFRDFHESLSKASYGSPWP